MNTVTAIDSFRDSLCRLMAAMSPAGVNCVVQMAILVLLPTVLCGGMYLYSVKKAQATQSTPSVNRGVQFSLLFVGLLSGLSLPVSKLEIFDPLVRLWVVSICAMLVGLLPILLGFLLAPNAYAQKITIRTLYVVILVLSAWQIFRDTFQ